MHCVTVQVTSSCWSSISLEKDANLLSWGLRSLACPVMAGRFSSKPLLDIVELFCGSVGDFLGRNALPSLWQTTDSDDAKAIKES